MTELDALIVLNAIPSAGPAKIKELLALCGSARAVLETPMAVLRREIAGSEKLWEHWSTFRRDEFLATESRLMHQHQVRVCSFTDEAFPHQLKNIAQSPVLLYVKGQWPEASQQCLGIVGSRQASLYGVGVAKKLAIELVERGVVVVSGLARGIDAAAHAGALEAGGQTIGVVGCGLAHLYPLENARLWRDIPQAGIIVSEFPMLMEPLAKNFPRRNRIISGLSSGIIVVEAALNSGALITVDYALEQGRDVYAVPGPWGCPQSQGVNRLIQQGAKLIMSVDDVWEEMENTQSQTVAADAVGHRFSEVIEESLLSERDVFTIITHSPKHIDALAAEMNCSTENLSRPLLDLELKRLVKQLPGKWFVRALQN